MFSFNFVLDIMYPCNNYFNTEIYNWQNGNAIVNDRSVQDVEMRSTLECINNLWSGGGGVELWNRLIISIIPAFHYSKGKSRVRLINK